MSGLPDYALADDELLVRCRVDRHRSGGPGGQHANRTASAVRLVHEASGVQAVCQDARDQHINRSRALIRLRLRLALLQRGAADPHWVHERRRGRRLPVGVGAAGYHLVVAALLDALEAESGSLAACAARFGIGSSQAAAVLCADKEVRQAADALRGRFGLGPLR